MPIPSPVEFRQKDDPKPIDFPDWEFRDGAEIKVDSVTSRLVGLLPANMNAVWKFSSHGKGTGGMGVRAFLAFDRTASVPPHCIPFYDEVLWPQRDLLTLQCSYPGEKPEALEVQLVYP